MSLQRRARAEGNDRHSRGGRYGDDFGHLLGAGGPDNAVGQLGGMEGESIGVLAADRFATSQAPRKSPLQRLQSGSEIMGKGLRTSPALVIRSRLQCRHCPPLLASTATIIPVEIRTLPDRPTLRASSKIGVLQIHITATPNIRQDPFALPFRPPAARLGGVCWHGARAHKPRGVLSCCEGW